MKKSIYNKLGFSNEDIAEMVRKFPNTLNLSAKKINDAYQNLLEQGLTQEQAHFFLRHTPSILGMKVDTVIKKFAIYKEAFRNNYIQVLEKNPRRLILSPEKAQKRLDYLRKVTSSTDELEKGLFMGAEKFQRKYGVDL